MFSVWHASFRTLAIMSDSLFLYEKKSKPQDSQPLRNTELAISMGFH